MRFLMRTVSCTVRARLRVRSPQLTDFYRRDEAACSKPCCSNSAR